MNRSPTRHQFATRKYIERLELEPDNENALLMLDYYSEFDDRDKQHEQDPEWCKDNLEYDLRSTAWIIEKAKSDEVYAQHLYAALCNNEFQKNDVWPILTDKKWSCSWRHAGAVVSDMREEGDYMNFYCSGIVNDDPVDEEVFQNLDDNQKRDFFQARAYVAESVVTDEIREDLFKLGWVIVIDNSSD